MNPEYCRRWVSQPTFKQPRYIRPEPKKPFGIQNVKRHK